jgi:hypothetical protein
MAQGPLSGLTPLFLAPLILLLLNLLCKPPATFKLRLDPWHKPPATFALRLGLLRLLLKPPAAFAHIF